MTSLTLSRNQEFFEELRQMNENFLECIKRLQEVTPYSDFSVKFGDYSKELERLCSKYPLNRAKSVKKLEATNGTVNNKEKIPSEICDSNIVDSVSSGIENDLRAVSIFDKPLLGDKIDKEVKNSVKRNNYITWDEYFMSVALLAARRSKDPSTQVGACIVSRQNKIVATGYNGMPNGLHDDLVPWNKEGPFLETKYAYVVHAELNAILNCNLADQTTCRVYVTLFPCNECAKAIIQVGIRHVIYLSDKHRDKESTQAAKTMLKMAGVLCEQYSSLFSKTTNPDRSTDKLHHIDES